MQKSTNIPFKYKGIQLFYLALILRNWENSKKDLESEIALLKLPCSQHSYGFLRDLRWLLVEVYLLTALSVELALSLSKHYFRHFRSNA